MDDNNNIKGPPDVNLNKVSLSPASDMMAEVPVESPARAGNSGLNSTVGNSESEGDFDGFSEDDFQLYESKAKRRKLMRKSRCTVVSDDNSQSGVAVGNSVGSTGGSGSKVGLSKSNTQGNVFVSRSGVGAGATARPPTDTGGGVVIVTPTGVHAQSFLDNSRLRKKALVDSLFYAIGIRRVTVNERKRHVVVEIADDGRVNELCQIEKLGDFNVSCSVPYSNRVYSGVLVGIPPKMSVQDITDSLEEEGYLFEKVIRLHKTLNDIRTPTTEVRVDFLTPIADLPPFVDVDFYPYKLREYRFSPTRCFNCQSFGHISDRCGLKLKGKIKCAKCSGDHDSKNCSADDFKCPNCGGAHAAFMRQLPKYNEAQQITDIVKGSRCSYAEATRIVKQRKNTSSSTGPTSVGVSTDASSSTSAPSGTSSLPPRVTDASTQTDVIPSDSDVAAVPNVPVASVSTGDSSVASGSPTLPYGLSLAELAVFIAGVVKTVQQVKGSQSVL